MTEDLEAPFLLTGEEPEEHRPRSTDELLAAILHCLERLLTMTDQVADIASKLNTGLGTLNTAITAALSTASGLAPSADDLAALGTVATGLQSATDELNAFVTANTAAPEPAPVEEPAPTEEPAV